MPLSSVGVGADFTALETNATSPYFKYPFSVSPLPGNLRWSLLAPGLMGLLSSLSSTGLLSFILYRFITWRKHAKIYLGYNQYLVLFINLLVADLQQSISFTVSFHWIAIDAIQAPSPACFAQGWLLNIGDVASAFFVLFIACHTFYTTVKGRRMGYKTFLGLVAFTWSFAILLTFLGPAIHGRLFFVRTGAWCWVSALYQDSRLGLHYFWIFFVQFATMIIYLLILIHIKATMRKTISITRPDGTKSATHRKVDRAAKSMVLFPVAYIILTLPLSAGRMWSLAHHGAYLPNSYVVLAGTMLCSSGFVDCLLYALTRRQLMHMSGGSSLYADGTNKHTGGGSALESGRRKSSFASAAVRRASAALMARPAMRRAVTHQPVSTQGFGGLGVGGGGGVVGGSLLLTTDLSGHFLSAEKRAPSGDERDVDAELDLMAKRDEIRVQRFYSIAVPDHVLSVKKRSSSVPNVISGNVRAGAGASASAGSGDEKEGQHQHGEDADGKEGSKRKAGVQVVEREIDSNMSSPDNMV